MSEEVLKIVPEDKNYVPDMDKSDEARTLLKRMFPDGEQAEVKAANELYYIDGGEYTEKVGCPICGAECELSEDGNSDWWYELIGTITSEASKLEFLQTEMPCCKKSCFVQDIDFFGTAAFAKFELCVWNPNNSITDQQIAQLEHLLGCKLKQVWAHY